MLTLYFLKTSQGSFFNKTKMGNAQKTDTVVA